ncbi:MAG: hypothetical protein K2Q22_13565, partial [Cytophagales bacterium]|nr:hypothetical protein [Cytophagales bacterium]
DRHNELMQFSYIVSHNLRAPIASTLGLAQIINLPNVDMEEKLKLTGHILSSVRKMDDLLKDLNNILASQSTLNKSKENIQIADLLDNIKGILKQQIIDADAEITVHLAPQATEIFTIKAYLESILYNLISNAIKFKSPHRPLQVTISTQKEQNKLILKVADNGKGIDLKTHDKNIFGLYKRFHLEVEGKGLGLHMTKLQVEAIGGKIEIESAPNQGATFIIQLNA